MNAFTTPSSTPPSEPSDRLLVARVNDGESAAFAQLYERHRDWCLSVAMRFVHDADRAMDITQESFLYWLRRFPPHAPPFELTAQVRTYLYTIVRSLSLTHHRRERTARAHAPFLAPSRGAAPAGHESTDRSRILRAALDRLSAGHREVLLLRIIDGFTLDEIALAMNLPLGTVKSRLHHALRLLRDDPAARELFFTDS